MGIADEWEPLSDIDKFNEIKANRPVAPFMDNEDSFDWLISEIDRLRDKAIELYHEAY